MKSARRRSVRRAAVAAWWGSLLWVAACTVAAVGVAGDPLYELPAAGSYDLPVIDRVSQHRLIDDSGAPAPVLDLQPGQCAVVTFVYANCPDAGGCPLLLAELRRVDRALQDRSDLAGRVELVTVSFDPRNDTPERMQMLRHHLRPKGTWRFLTAESDEALQPVLRDFGQDALRLVAQHDGRDLALIRHVAKVFLLDAEGGVRNVYSSGFLDDRMLVRDIETLLLANGSAPTPERSN